MYGEREHDFQSCVSIVKSTLKDKTIKSVFLKYIAEKKWFENWTWKIV